jgi:ribosomal subunit interface protein
MQTTITARHFEISDSLQERATAVLAKLESTAPRPIDAHVIFDIEGATSTAEIRLHLSQGEMMIATGEGTDHLTALDRSEEKLRSQLRRVTRRAHRERKPAPDQV